MTHFDMLSDRLSLLYEIMGTSGGVFHKSDYELLCASVLATLRDANGMDVWRTRASGVCCPAACCAPARARSWLRPVMGTDEKANCVSHVKLGK